MNKSPETVQHLKKVTLELWPMTGPKEQPHGAESKSLTFIYGLGPDGLTPFEMRLSGKSEGQELILQIEHNDSRTYFGHNLLWFMPDTKILDFPYLRVKILEIRQAEGREVIKAMAEISELGHQCSCC